MARPIAFNRNGIFGIETQGNPVVTSTNVIYNFENHSNVDFPYNGMLIIKITQLPASGTTQTLPIVFQTGSKQVTPQKTSGEDMTLADISGTGYYLFFYDYRTGVLQSFTGV